ncbi:MAG: hypothetical protein GX597_03655, partial [Anaerolineaceae bacterium]|nr:hypothetical protein [Anaerolineaceae bacterium]
NPAGRLPVTFYRSVDDLPPFEDYSMEGRTYRYFRGKALYPFGHGLSYSTFHYENLRISPAQATVGEQVTVSADVTNTGERAGDEVVQLYVRHPGAPEPRPIQELKAFSRISLEPGECRTATLVLDVDQLGLYDDSGRYVVRPGSVEVMVGGSSQHLPLAGSLQIAGRQPD